MECHSNCSAIPTWFICFLLSLSLLFIHTIAEVHHHEFVVQATPVKRLCKTHNIITVNGQFPGPTLEVKNGDTLVVKVVNRARYNITIHWHGVRQLRTGWADGPEYVTQCPIRPDGSYTYRFTIKGQEGTLWWHAHSSWLRATTHGALIIRPKENNSYPFAKPHREAPIILGEWWDKNPIDVVRQALRTGGAPNLSDAFTINGQPGDLYNCSSKGTTIVPVATGETVLLRFINAAMNTELFVAIAGHTMTVVGADSAYTKPFSTSVLLLGPGQTTDVLLTADKPSGRYYIAARAYAPAQGVPFDNTTTTAILEYKLSGCSSSNQSLPPPLLPNLPAFNDTNTAAVFAASFKSPSRVHLPSPVDHHLFFTIGFGLLPCPHHRPRCQGPNGTRFAASVNNVSYVSPSSTPLSMLQAHYLHVPGVFTADFPLAPPRIFDFTAKNVSRRLWRPSTATKVLPLKFGSVVEIVLQDTNIFAADSHPMHVHGYQFYILGEGFGNFDPSRDRAGLNLVDPPERNTVSVPVNGWAVIRFRADNPGVWLMHCHLDVHLTWGLAMAFVVEDGVGEMEKLEPPPADLPVC